MFTYVYYEGLLEQQRLLMSPHVKRKLQMRYNIWNRPEQQQKLLTVSTRSSSPKRPWHWLGGWATTGPTVHAFPQDQHSDRIAKTRLRSPPGIKYLHS